MECLLFSNVTFLRLLLVGSTRTIPLLTHGTRSHENGRLVSDQPAGAVNDKRAGGGYAADPPFRLSPWKHSLLGPGPSQPAFLLAARRPVGCRRWLRAGFPRPRRAEVPKIGSADTCISRAGVFIPKRHRVCVSGCPCPRDLSEPTAGSLPWSRRPGPATVLPRGCKSELAQMASDGGQRLRWRFASGG